MDPFTAATGIAGLIAVAVKTIQMLGEFTGLITEHKKHAESLHKELSLMTQVLDQLKSLIHKQKHSGRLRSADNADHKTILGKAVLDCTKIIEQIQEKLREPVHRFKRAMAKLHWPFEQKDIKAMVDDLHRYTELFQLSLVVENCELLSKTSDAAYEGLNLQRDNCKQVEKLSAGLPHMATVANDAKNTLQQTEALLKLLPTLLQGASSDTKEARKGVEQREHERRMTEVLDWLCPSAALQKHDDIKARRAPGTGAWFLNMQEIVSWLSYDSDSYEVLCLGDPGVGKTNLASLVVDKLLDLRKHKDIAVVYLYCDYREQQAQTPVNCARNMLRQLSMQYHVLPPVVSEFYRRTHNETQDQSWYVELQEILCKVASKFAKCFFVVDALDEAEASSHLRGLLELLDVLRRSITGGTPKIFATSRKHGSPIQVSFQEATRMTVSANKEDLRAIIEKAIADHQDPNRILDERLKEDIMVTLSTTAHGMCLLPVLQIRDILAQLTKSEVRRALRERSTNLPEVFKATIERILSLPADSRRGMTQRNVAARTLMWISHAKRVLTVTELQHVLAVRLHDSDLDRENFIHPQAVIDCCFGLVEIDQESLSIRFVHYSLEEYLRSHDHGLFKNGDEEVTKVCLKYLSLDSVKGLHIQNRKKFLESLGDLAFLDYAATEWGFHATNVAPQDVKDVALPFLRSSPHLMSAARVRDHRSPYFRKWHQRMSVWAYSESDGAGISTCASFGLTDFVRFLICENRQPMLKARNMYGSTPLHEAALGGYESTAKLLLEYGADVLDLNIGKSTPMYLAVGNGQVSMARLLLQQQSSVQLDIRARDGWTALHKAVDIGNEEMVTLLLRSGAMVDSEDEKRMRPLHLAARKGYLPRDFTSGHLEVARMLLDNGARVEHRGMDKWTVLHRAARGGHENLVALLLERGADVLAEDHKGEIPLHAAARSGSIRAVELLLNDKSGLKKEQLCKKERKGSTPRDVAFFTSHFGVHKLLRRAEVQNQEHPLTICDKIAAAIESGKMEKLRRLLAERSCEIDALIDGRQPALHLAIQEEQPDMVNLLLSHGADINSTGYHNWTPLHIAASIGHLALTQLCLARGANVAALTDTAQTPLHKACSSRNILVVKALLEAGADKTAKNQRGMGAIHVAAHQKNLDVVRLLVQDYGVSVWVVDNFGETAADWAARSGHLDLLQFLRSEEKKARQLQAASPIASAGGGISSLPAVFSAHHV
ncbi:hypothetical protein EPUS_03269 [Endocarpon pusillum Z07020]|uniref:Uncharacterized protein n=1 Tax=Endocarpon pusillum (strain Z07020 / HMAS-L-300199) TaxID=1263415 RepID=U1HL34_ENDPU|nr:uncharacterized protein EPUS_03269 [Endocarpon pusillum Z07020]ERF70990.1 hypothetical protein EPUS_03269 [Endocarpon pusillum Z07020]